MKIKSVLGDVVGDLLADLEKKLELAKPEHKEKLEKIKAIFLKKQIV